MYTFVSVLAEYPILTLFVVIGLGYLIGEVSVFGFRLGVAGVLFAGLAVGSLDARLALPEVVLLLGQIVFVYTIGIQSGPGFFASFRKQGCRDNLLAVSVLLFGAVLAGALAFPLGLSGARAAGLYCGSLTSTPAMAAAREIARERGRAAKLPAAEIARLASQPVVAYSVTYPIGVIGVLLCFQGLKRLWRVEMTPPSEAPEIQVRDFVVKNPGVAGKSVGEVLRVHKDLGFVISRIRHEGSTSIPRADTVLAFGDIVAVVGDEEALERAGQIFGEPSDARIELDRSELDYRRFFVSSKEVVGKRIGDLNLQDRLSATITRLRRGDIDVVPAPETRLEFGDFVRVLTRRSNFAAVSQFFGDSIRGTAETDFGSVAIGMVLGVMAGMLPIPIPGGPVVRLGLAGGPLLVALLLGKIERTGRIHWVIPVSANLTLRQVGLLFFLAGVGTRAGFGLPETLRENGLQLVLAGAAITFAVTLVTLVAGYKFLGIPYDFLMGLMSGIQTQTACLPFANEQARSDVPNAGYASVYPMALITKIVLAQVLVALR
jgi:putative transport protein